MNISASRTLPQQDDASIVDWQDLDDVYSPKLLSRGAFLNGLTVTLGRKESARIFVRGDAFRQMIEDAAVDVSREHGGILLGQAFRDSDESHFVAITSAVRAGNTAGSAVHLQFRPESWEPVWTQLNKNPELNVIGWYHTHPGLGVFLSGTDKRTQRLYFSQAWQVAIVIDPVRKKIGFFMGMEGEKCSAAVFRDSTQSTVGSLR